MCTDVDRNDKSRVCVPGSVQVIGRRLIESYAGLFHTVDHVEGMLAEGFDSLDAFLTHMWAVTLIGAPKKWAAQAIEIWKRTRAAGTAARSGMISLNGDINTGILIRTIYLRDGMARYPRRRDPALRFVPAMEERETRIKATGFLPRAECRAAPSPRRYRAEIPTRPPACGCCWSITTIASSTRWRIMRGRPAPKS